MKKLTKEQTKKVVGGSYNCLKGWLYVSINNFEGELILMKKLTIEQTKKITGGVPWDVVWFVCDPLFKLVFG